MRLQVKTLGEPLSSKRGGQGTAKTKSSLLSHKKETIFSTLRTVFSLPESDISNNMPKCTSDTSTKSWLNLNTLALQLLLDSYQAHSIRIQKRDPPLRQKTSHPQPLSLESYQFYLRIEAPRKNQFSICTLTISRRCLLSLINFKVTFSHSWQINPLYNLVLPMPLWISHLPEDQQQQHIIKPNNIIDKARSQYPI